MTRVIANPAEPVNTRRWPRYHVNLPVSIVAEAEAKKIAVPGLASELSQSGMALYGGIDLQPGDLMEVEFQTCGKRRVAGVVRNRSGFCFGLEFLDLMANSETLADLVQPDRTAGPIPPWRSWLSAHRGDVSVAIAVLLFLLTSLGTSWRSAYRSAQASTSPVPALTLSERILVGLGLAEPPAALLVVGNPNAQVWVDVHTALYYCPGSELYGKTPGGKFTTQRDAQLDQFEPAARQNCE
jgi:hypothetical protein